MTNINQTHEAFVSLETAKLLKQAGFDWKCQHCYFNGKFDCDLYEPENFLDSTYQIAAPTLDVAQRWLRQVKKYYVAWEFNMNIGSCGHELYDFTDIIVYIFVECEQGNICKCRLKENYKTIEEAIEAGIKKALGLILEKGE